MKPFGSGIVAAALAALLLAACGNGSGTSSTAPNSPTQPVTIGTDKVSGVGVVLDDAQGSTLYHLTTESDSTIVCTGSCASTWPPVLASGILPAGSPALSGTFGTVVRPDGTKQLTYDDMPLYTYAGDTEPGQANGQGVQGVWFAVTPSGSGSPSGELGTNDGGSSGISGGYGY